MRLKGVIHTLEGSPTNKDDLKELLNAFDELQLLTPEDVILRSSEQEPVEKIPPNIIDRRNIAILFQEIVDVIAAVPQRGDVLYPREQESTTGLGGCLSTGVPAINGIIRLPDSGIIELAGLPATGKTVLQGRKVTTPPS